MIRSECSVRWIKPPSFKLGDMLLINLVDSHYNPDVHEASQHRRPVTFITDSFSDLCKNVSTFSNVTEGIAARALLLVVVSVTRNQARYANRSTFGDNVYVEFGGVGVGTYTLNGFAIGRKSGFITRLFYENIYYPVVKFV